MRNSSGNRRLEEDRSDEGFYESLPGAYYNPPSAREELINTLGFVAIWPGSLLPLVVVSHFINPHHQTPALPAIAPVTIMVSAPERPKTKAAPANPLAATQQ